MQKVINVLALASFGVSLAVVASGSWVYVNRYKLINDVKNMAADEIAEMVPSMISGAMNPMAPGAVGGKQGPIAIPVLPFGG